MGKGDRLLGVVVFSVIIFSAAIIPSVLPAFAVTLTNPSFENCSGVGLE